MSTPSWVERFDERRWHYRRSLASRVILLTTFTVGITVAVLALGAYVTVRVQMQAALDASLLNRAERAASDETLANLTKQEVPSWMLGAADVRMVFVTERAHWFSVDGGPTLELGQPELDVASGESPQSVRTVEAGDIRYRVVAVPAGEGSALVLAQSLESRTTVLDRLGIVMLLFGVAGVIAAGIAGWGVARNGLRPVRRLTFAAEDIARTEDLTPIPFEGNDEIARLASAFNTMLAALAASRDRQRRLIGDAGHELRTPLTSLRTNLDLLLQADETGGMEPEARTELLEDVRAQIEEMTTLIGDLVELARDDQTTHLVTAVSLSDLVDRSVARARRRSPTVSFDVRTDEWWVTGEAGALERAVMNLLDNAVKWSPPDGTVQVRLHDGTLTVVDQGPGIAEADLPRVFDRFYRSEESRSMPGSGLGLSIVRQTAIRHSGWVDAMNVPGAGACLTLTLPGQATEPEHV